MEAVLSQHSMHSTTNYILRPSVLQACGWHASISNDMVMIKRAEDPTTITSNRWCTRTIIQKDAKEMSLPKLIIIFSLKMPVGTVNESTT